MKPIEYEVIDPRRDIIGTVDIPSEAVSFGRKLVLQPGVDICLAITEKNGHVKEISVVFFSPEGESTRFEIIECLDPLDIKRDIVISGQGFVSQYADTAEYISAYLLARSVKKVRFTIEYGKLHCEMRTAQRSISGNDDFTHFRQFFK